MATDGTAPSVTRVTSVSGMCMQALVSGGMHRAGRFGASYGPINPSCNRSSGAGGSGASGVPLYVMNTLYRWRGTMARCLQMVSTARGMTPSLPPPSLPMPCVVRRGRE
jgi:hypothetical protein